MKDSHWAQMEERRRARQEIRAILANPKSTQKQVIQAKLTLAQRMAEGSTAVREICVKYNLSEEQSSKIIDNHQLLMGTNEKRAKQTVQELEQLLRQLHKSPESEPPAT